MPKPRMLVMTILAAISHLGFGQSMSESADAQANSNAGPSAAEVKKQSPEEPWLYEPKEIRFQSDADWMDNRWQQTDTGQFLSASINMPRGPSLKGIAVRVGPHDEAAVCYDTALLRMSAAWTGPFLNFDPVRFGLIRKPAVAGTMQFTLPVAPGWAKDGNFDNPRPGRGVTRLPKDWAHYKGLYLHEKRVVLEYTVGETTVLESPWIESADGLLAITRTLQIGPSKKPMTMRVCSAKARAHLVGSDRVKLRTDGNRPVLLDVPAHAETLNLKMLIWSGKPENLPQFESLVRRTSPPEDLRVLAQPGRARWTERIVTQGVTSDDKAPYVIDTLPLPFNNPYRALMFTSGHDFFSNGDAAVCTVHGDVWIVSGIDDDLPYGNEQLIYELSPAGESLGLSIADIGRQLRAAYDGIILQRFQQGADEVEVRLQLPESEQRRLDSLLHLPIKLPNGEFVALETVARWRSAQGFETLRHFNGRLSVDVSADVNAALNNTAEIVADLQQFTLPALASKFGIQYSVEGRSASQRETFADMRLGAIIALVLMYLVLAWVFSSYGWPLLVMLTIPLGLTGAVLGHWLMGMNLTILSMFGFFGLSGIVVNDSIILVIFLSPDSRTRIVDTPCPRGSSLPALAGGVTDLADNNRRSPAVVVRNFPPGPVPDTHGGINRVWTRLRNDY